MNFDEGKKFVIELITAFPAFESAAKDAPDIGATHRSWIAAWDDLAITECRAVLSQLIKSGGIGWDDYRQPGPFVRRLVIAARRNELRSEEDLAKERRDRNEREKNRRQYVGSPMALALCHGLDLRKQGATQEVIYAAMDRILVTGKV